MATITKPPILDETGQDIVTKLNNINTQVTALNALIADLGLVSITPISQADYNNLSPTDKLNGVFDIYDAVEPQIDGDSVYYDSNTSIKQAVDNVETSILSKMNLKSSPFKESRSATSITFSGTLSAPSFAIIVGDGNSTTPTFSVVATHSSPTSITNPINLGASTVSSVTYSSGTLTVNLNTNWSKLMVLSPDQFT